MWNKSISFLTHSPRRDNSLFETIKGHSAIMMAVRDMNLYYFFLIEGRKIDATRACHASMPREHAAPNDANQTRSATTPFSKYQIAHL